MHLLVREREAKLAELTVKFDARRQADEAAQIAALQAQFQAMIAKLESEQPASPSTYSQQVRVVFGGADFSPNAPLCVD
jgi:hypothetical protein